MLQRIRDNASGPLAYVIVGLIALVFSVWGIGSYFTESPNPAVAAVGDIEITQYQLQRAYDQRYQRLQRLMGESFDHEAIDPATFRRSVLESLIQQALLAQYAEDAGYRVTDAALLDALQSDDRFQVDGSFSVARYQTLLAQAGISAAAFEAGLRNDLQVGQVRETVLGTAFVTHRAVGQVFDLLNQRRKLAYLRFAPEDYRDQVEVSAAEVEAYYRDTPEAFLRPEAVKLAYVVLDRSELEVAEVPDEAFLKALYEQEKAARFKTPERRLARHILVRIDEDTDAAQARQTVQDLAAKLESGADFAALAREHSDDQATVEQGGKLDWITRGTMVAGFEEALFKLKVGQVSAPVKTEFGWHLIKLLEVDEPEIKPFDAPEVQAELLALYREQEREERFRQMRESLDALSFEAPSSLEPIAEELGVEIQTSGWITRAGGEGLAANEAVIKAAFSDAVLKDRLNSTPIQLSGDRQVVLRVQDYRDAAQKPLEEVRADIRAQLEQQAAAAVARSRAEAALEQARAGKALTAIAENTAAKLLQPGWVERGNSELAESIVATLFALPHPALTTGEGSAPSAQTGAADQGQGEDEGGQADQNAPADQTEAAADAAAEAAGDDVAGDGAATYGLAPLGDGAVALLKLAAVATPEPGADAKTQALRRDLRARIAGLEYSVLSQALRDNYEVEIFYERLN